MIRRLLAGAAFAAALAATPALADRALVIGIDRYNDSRIDVGGNSSAADVAEIVDLLRTNALGYDEKDIRILKDGEATRQAILDSIREWLIDGTKPGDRVYFYYSGQGYFEDDTSGDENDRIDETLVPADAAVSSDQPPTISGMISDDELISMFKRLNDRKVTILVDAGYSGLISGAGARKHPKDGSFRVASLDGGTVTRSIVVEPKAQAQKADGPPLDTDGLGPNVAVFTATSGGQAPIIADGSGAFTSAYVEAVKAGAADANQNGVVSNAEILAYVRDKSETACAKTEGCDLGLTPTLEPAGAAGETPAATPPGDAKLTVDRILDYFAKGNSEGVILEQMPPSPVYVGTKDIRFRVVSPTEGNLILLDLSDDGTLTQLFPNQYVKDDGRLGYVLPDSPIVIPDDYYGIRFNATSPTSGTLIAIVTAEPIEMPTEVKTRKMEVIPREEATTEYLPAIVASLDKPVDTASTEPTRTIDWSVATLRYEILK